MKQSHHELRCHEIMDAAAKLYETMTFREISLKEISKITTFSRPTIYNYFQSKEEIFLGLLGREYRALTNNLESVWMECREEAIQENASQEERITSYECLSQILSDVIAKHPLILKILAKDIGELEHHSRFERIVAFKKEYKACVDKISSVCQQMIPTMSDEVAKECSQLLISFIFSVYPMTQLSKTQLAAMQEAGFQYDVPSMIDYLKLGFITILKGYA